MRTVLGIDGGGSKTACLAADETGRLLGYGRGSSTNTNYVLRQQAVDSMERAIGTALEQAGLEGSQIETLCLSAPISPDALQEVAAACDLGHVVRAAEGQTPRWAARFWVDGRVGVTVDAGTGSLARGWSRDDQQAAAGGWGATLGDEGSGHWIGMEAMTAILQAHDGRIAETMLTAPLLKRLDAPNLLDMVFKVSHGLVTAEHSEQGVGPDSGSGSSSPAGDASEGGVLIHQRTGNQPLSRHQVAQLCPTVVEVARQGDWKAIEILQRAGCELGRLGTAIIMRLGMEDDEFVVVPFGGVFKAGELVLASFRETIEAVAPHARVIEPCFEPVVGAVLLALDDISIEIDDRILAAVEASSANFPDSRHK